MQHPIPAAEEPAAVLSGTEVPEADALARLLSASVPTVLAAMGSDPDPDLVTAMRHAIEPVRLRAGETLFESGSEPDAAYFMVTGGSWF